MSSSSSGARANAYILDRSNFVRSRKISRHRDLDLVLSQYKDRLFLVLFGASAYNILGEVYCIPTYNIQYKSPWYSILHKSINTQARAYISSCSECSIREPFQNFDSKLQVVHFIPICITVYCIGTGDNT